MQSCSKGRPSKFYGEFWCRVVGTIVAVAVAAGFVSPRTLPYSLPIIVVALLIFGWESGARWSLRPRGGAAEWTLAALLAYATITMAWAFRPTGTIGPAFTGFACFYAYLIIVQTVFTSDRELARRLAEGLWIGLLVGLIYLGFEILTDQAVKLNLYRGLDIPKSWLRPGRDFTWHDGVLVSIAPTDLTRNIAPVTLLIWPALLVIEKISRPETARILRWVLILTAAIVVMNSEHETSKVGLVVGGVIYFLALAHRTYSYRLLQLLWVGVCLAIVPLTLALHHFGLHEASWIQDTLRHRIVIWHHTAEEAMHSPVFGIGAGMMYQLDPGGEKPAAGHEFSAVAPHAHNIYLQSWFELGAIGVAILTLFGLAVLERIRALPPRVVPYAHATFASAMCLTSASYGMWQPWFISMFAMGAAMFLIVIRLYVPDDVTLVDAQQSPGA